MTMTHSAERRALQCAVALACFLPLFAGALGIWFSATFIDGVERPFPTDLDSHFRYLSGLLLGIGLVFAASIPRIETRTAIFRALGAIIIAGGLARLLSLVETGPPTAGHLFGLCMELVVAPLLVLWQGRVARRHAEAQTR